ncbi:uncharacterized protein C2orf72 homolog [Hemicordylus capensis]|uniref:uncharacterized protein C2orf72 homolog n=1 Tax=Hemicordylus capensis TaxID=884348 RepID=UPI00230385D7|nr:uncharacterized protein C2orf72 homolog [Hemicordylus capensis]
MEPPAAAAALLQEFQGLVERVGGRQQLLMVGEAPRALLETFARDLFAEPAAAGSSSNSCQGAPPQGKAAAAAAESQVERRRVRVRLGGLPGWGCRRRRRLSCQLLFILFQASSLRQPRWRRERLRLREILRDVRSQLPSRRRCVAAAAGAPAAFVGVVVEAAAAAAAAEPERVACCKGASSPPAREEEEAARLQLEALLRQVFPERRRQDRRRRPGLQDTLQTAVYAPGTPQGVAEVRAAACRALKAALKLRADGVEAKRLCLPAFLQCLPWGRRSQRRKGHEGKTASDLGEDGLQDPEEGIPLTNMAPNGNCEEGCGGSGP